MVKIYPHVAGNTLDCHETILKKLHKRGAKIVDSPDISDCIIVFCPIVTRFQTDVSTALSEISEQNKKLIVVAMHHTFDPNYTLPDKRHREDSSVELLVDCLFHETKGFYKCSRNKKAKKTVYKELGLKRKIFKVKKNKERKDKNLTES